MIYQLHDDSIFTVRCRFVVLVQPTTFGVLCFATADQRQWITPGVTSPPPRGFWHAFFPSRFHPSLRIQQGNKILQQKNEQKVSKILFA